MLEQNIRKQIDCKKPSSTKQVNRVQNICTETCKQKYNQVRLVLASFVYAKLTLNRVLARPYLTTFSIIFPIHLNFPRSGQVLTLKGSIHRSKTGKCVILFWEKLILEKDALWKNLVCQFNTAACICQIVLLILFSIFKTIWQNWEFSSYDPPNGPIASYDPPNWQFASYDPSNWQIARSDPPNQQIARQLMLF